jgi:hypothetical protein
MTFESEWPPKGSLLKKRPPARIEPPGRGFFFSILLLLKLRPTGLGHGVYKDNVDYNVFSGEWLIGRIYERNGFPDEVRFFWSLHGVALTRPPGIHTDGHAPTLDDARANFQKSWDAWKAWAIFFEGRAVSPAGSPGTVL